MQVVAPIAEEYTIKADTKFTSCRIRSIKLNDPLDRCNFQALFQSDTDKSLVVEFKQDYKDLKSNTFLHISNINYYPDNWQLCKNKIIETIRVSDIGQKECVHSDDFIFSAKVFFTMEQKDYHILTVTNQHNGYYPTTVHVTFNGVLYKFCI